MKDLFKSKFPIVSVAMNKVSNAKLAIAVSKEGCVPSITSFNFLNKNEMEYELLEKELSYFFESCPNSEVILSVNDTEIFSNRFKLTCKNFNITHLEIIIDSVDFSNGITLSIKNFLNNLTSEIFYFKNLGIKILFKSLSKKLIVYFESFYPDLFDGYILKGNNAAGMVIKKSESLLDEIIFLKKQFPLINLIPAGGISNSIQIRNFLINGACAVGIGTLFALSLESPIPIENKKKIIRFNSSNIQKIGTMNQNAIVFKTSSVDDKNNTVSLMNGLNDITTGLIFIGNGIDEVCEIISVEQLVKKLIKDLQYEL